jgi:cell division protein FtsW (lipid II flippase)
MNAILGGKPNRGLLETLLTLAAVVWLVWRGGVFGGPEFLSGTDGRYGRDVQLRVELTEEAVRTGWLREVCRGFYDHLPNDATRICKDSRPQSWRERLDKALGRPASEPPRQARPVTAETLARVGDQLKAMQSAHAGLSRSFFKPLETTKSQYDAWQEGAREGFADEDERDRIKHLLEKTGTYRETYRLELREDQAYPRPFQCAWAYLSRRAGAPPPAGGEAGPVLALAGLAALLDGRSGKLPAEAFPAGQGWNENEAQAGCREFRSPLEAARLGADLMSLARASAGNADKAAAVLEILPKARWQLAVWALTGLIVVKLGRLGGRPQRTLFAALMLWAVAALATRPHLEWLGGGGEIGLLSGGWKPPLLLSGLAVLALFLPLGRVLPAAAPSSGGAYPGFVLFTGLSGWLLFDLSAYGYFDNRFQGLYQQGYLYAAFVAVSLVSVLRAPLARLGLRALTLWPLLAAGRTGRTLLWSTLAALAAGGVLAAIVVGLREHRQLTSELFRLPLILGLAWFLLARGDMLASAWLRPPNRPGSGWGWRLRWELALLPIRLKLVFPAALLVAFVVVGLRLTDDNGPLLVVLYAGSIFAGLGVAVLFAGKLGWRLGLALGMAAVPLYVWAGSFALFRYGGRLGTRIRERLESAENPFLAGNDQMAHVLWFQEAAREAGGFGFGAVPWCGELTGACRGVPPQIQSDYLFTALVGVFGPWAWAWLALFILWLWRLARSHPAATSGRVEADDLGQAWLSWTTLCWVALTLTQLAITVAGNQGWLPLTGITFPFLSFGSWSLLANGLFLGLALNLNRRAP